MGRIIFMLGLLCSLIGCGQARPIPPAGCVAPAYKLLPSRFDPSGLGEVDPASPRPLGAALAESLEAGRNSGLDAAQRVLLLSGGSQHGSFGAGLFKGLGQFADYQIVTGVSTGALQSTFVFLANRPVPSDRIYPEYMRQQPDFAQPGASSVTDLGLAYRVPNERDLMKVGRLGMAGALFNGSAANFGPLRHTLMGLISRDTIKQVADEGDLGRKLLVGIANVDDGYGYAVDLTMLAQQAVENNNIEAAQRCYVEALLASSSVPPGVPPVSLNIGVIRSDETLSAPEDAMFIDGGARYGVFFGQLHDSVAQNRATDMDLIVNGFLYGRPWDDSDGQPRKKWNAIDLALRAVDLMENQVYRLSIGDAQRWAVDHGRLRMAFISNEDLQTMQIEPLDWTYRGKTCAQWKAADKAEYDPMEFYPNYMKCIVDYGEHRGREDAWNRVVEPTGDEE